MVRTFCLLLLAATTLAGLAAALASAPLAPLAAPMQQSLGQLFAVTLVGRVLLALLPPGLPGAHGLSPSTSGGLVTTLATSFALGLLFHTGLAEGAELAGLSLNHSLATLLVLALGLLLWWTGPSDLVPRHEPAPERLAGRAKAAATLALVVVAGLALSPLGMALWGHAYPATVAFRAPGVFLTPAMALASFPAGVALVVFTANAAGLGVLGRRLVGVAAAATPAVWTSLGHPVSAPLGPAFMAAALVTAGGVAWLRRADRRGASLAIVGGLGLVWSLPVELAVFGPPFALASFVALGFATPAPGRRRIGRPLAAATFAALALATVKLLPALPEPGTAPLLEPLWAFLDSWALEKWGALFILADLVGLAALLRRPWSRAIHPRHELWFVWLLAASTALFVVLWALALGGVLGNTLHDAQVRGCLVLMAPSALGLVALLAGELRLPRRR